VAPEHFEGSRLEGHVARDVTMLTARGRPKYVRDPSDREFPSLIVQAQQPVTLFHGAWGEANILNSPLPANSENFCQFYPRA